jgi:type IV pilus assembly protein PilO
MNLEELNELDINNIGNWPIAVKAIVIVIACALVAGAVVWFDTLKQLDQLESIQNKETGLKSTLTAKAKKAANLDELKQQLEEMGVAFSKLRRQLPKDTEVAALLVDISQTGLASGLEFELFRPQAEIPKDFYAELPIQIRVKGTYHEFGTFASGVAALPRIVTLHNISLSPPQGSSQEMVMTATAKTYRYLDDEEAGK